MSYALYQWIEEYLFYRKTILQQVLSFLLLPLSFLYGFLAFTKRKLNPPIDMKIPIISIGNLSIGGNGKTPLCISIAKHINAPVGIILRGYKRESKKLLQVSMQGNVLCPVEESGDEAMLIAQRLSFANVIVCVDRVEAIKLAISQGVEYILLDDGFSKSHIQKYDILIQSKEHRVLNKRVLPSGCYREFAFSQKYASKIAIEDVDFFRKVHMSEIKDISKTVLITSISKPKRLDEFLPKGINKVYFSDHHLFTLAEIEDILKTHNATTILTTKKDFVKMQDLGIDDSVEVEIIYLQVTLEKEFSRDVEHYIKSHK